MVTADGKSLDVMREEHRHNEKIEEIKDQRQYHQELTKIASDIPERIGRGIAGHIGEEEIGRGSRGSGGGLDSITCTEEGCGTKIYITPETGSQVVCPRCGTVYTRKGEVTE